MIEPGNRVNVGLPGTGKSYAIREEVYEWVRAGMQVIVLDRMREWESVPHDLGSVAIPSRSVEDVLRHMVHTDKRLGIVRLDIANAESEADLACQWACSTGALTGVAIPEAHRVFPKTFGRDAGTRTPGLVNVVSEWRHHNVAIWADSQRFSMLNTDLIEAGRIVRLFAMSGHNDLTRLRDFGGRELEQGVKECARRYVAGEPGWHVRLEFGIVAFDGAPVREGSPDPVPGAPEAKDPPPTEPDKPPADPNPKPPDVPEVTKPPDVKPTDG